MFYYFATPYTKYPHGLEKAFELAAVNAAMLLRAGVPIFCPIVHTHPMAMYGNIDPTDAPFWMSTQVPFVRLAEGIIALRAESWKLSHGMTEELREFAREGKKVIYMDPGIIPEELR